MKTIEKNDNIVLPENAQAAATWSSGGERYERISRQIADAIEHAVDRLDPQPGEKVLDVATGTGWAARRIATRGASVAGIDIGADVIKAARHIDACETIDFQVGDAEALPFADGEFDGVTSTFGVMFCGNPERAASELGRVCRPGGRLSLATWATYSGVFDLFGVIKKYVPAPPVPKPSPFAWGSTERLTELLGNDFDLAFEEGVSYHREPNAESAWEAFSLGYGPVVTLLSKLDDAQKAQFKQDFLAYHEKHQTGAGILVPRPYVITVGTRRA